MKPHLLDLTVFLAIASVVALVVALGIPASRGAVAHAYLLVGGAALLLALVAAIASRVPSRPASAFTTALAPTRRSDERLPQLERLEREVTLGVSSAYDLHVRLLPTLREIAQARLERTGRRPGPETLGPWWDLLRPDRPAPEDRFAPGISPHDLRALVDHLRDG